MNVSREKLLDFIEGFDSANCKNKKVDFTIRNIDKIIHQYQSVMDEQTINKHQTKIINIIRGLEKAIFNDPRVCYNIQRPFLNGITGTMSTILICGYYILYNQLLAKGLQVNANDDLRIIFNALLQIDMKSKSFIHVRPTIKNIIAQLLNKSTLRDFKNTWWDDLDIAMKELFTFYKSKTELDTNLISFLTYLKRPGAPPDIIEIQNIISYTYQPWESRPDFILSEITINIKPSEEKPYELLEKIKDIRLLFPSVRTSIIPSTTTNYKDNPLIIESENLVPSQILSESFYLKKYLKYKTKFLQLKNKNKINYFAKSNEYN